MLNALQSVNMVWSLQSQMSELAETVVKIIELVKQMLYIHHKYIEKSCAEQVKMIEGFESELYAHINKKVLVSGVFQTDSNLQVLYRDQKECIFET